MAVSISLLLKLLYQLLSDWYSIKCCWGRKFCFHYVFFNFQGAGTGLDTFTWAWAYSFLKSLSQHMVRYWFGLWWHALQLLEHENVSHHSWTLLQILTSAYLLVLQPYLNSCKPDLFLPPMSLTTKIWLLLLTAIFFLTIPER